MQKLLLIVLFQAALARESFTQRVPYKGMKCGDETYTPGIADHRTGERTEYLSYVEGVVLLHEGVVYFREDIKATERSLQISQKLLNLSRIVNPNTGLPLAVLESIGKSYEKRVIHMLKISSNHSMGKPVVVLEGGMHAREWASPATVLFLAEQLTSNFTHNQDILNDVDYYIIPLVNPDGYEFSRNSVRLWRKTRTPYGECYGADGNRNFDFHWNESGASPSVCGETYAGPKPFSEVETQNLRDLGNKHGKNILVYIAVHYFGSYILYPYGYSQDLPENWKELDKCASKFAGAVEKFSGTEYTYGSSGQVFYEAAGGSDDWFLGVVGVRFSYTLELPALHGEDFPVKRTELTKIGQEVLVGIEALVWCSFNQSQPGA